jgi:NAD(P)-dependent dehydrogenase (short-subunit alcohol dehydrogenase family)
MPYQHIAITGASSGLGRALTLSYAHPGITLHLAARHAERLAEVAATARSLGASVTETLLDVTDAPATIAWVASLAPLDLMIANAGISGGPGAANLETPEQIAAIFATNVTGAFNTVLPAMALMASQPPAANGYKGRVAIIGSIAGLIALPTSPAYSAAKAALDFWVTATAPNAAKEGIGLTLIRPGFIRTPMTAKNPYKMPGLMDADQAARIIAKGLAAGKTHITFPAWFGAFARVGQMLNGAAPGTSPDRSSSARHIKQSPSPPRPATQSASAAAPPGSPPAPSSPPRPPNPPPAGPDAHAPLLPPPAHYPGSSTHRRR